MTKHEAAIVLAAHYTPRYKVLVSSVVLLLSVVLLIVSASYGSIVGSVASATALGQQYNFLLTVIVLPRIIEWQNK